ncbi:MAG: alpha/beta hydrolase [Bacteroidetes bacterium]|nr:MAG: alpha/beta hydrolase [Bacteroidota bacterium]
MKHLLLAPLLVLTTHLWAQTPKAEDLGFRHIQTSYLGDTVDVLIKSKKGEENLRKPVFFFCQGSLPQPLIKYEDGYVYSVFPFSTDSLEKDYHIVIVGKPYVPLVMDAKKLGQNFIYQDFETGQMPAKYSERNFPAYYVERNIKVIRLLKKQAFVDPGKLVVAGHSEGSTIAAKLAAKSRAVTHLIYASGNPLGRIMTILAQYRASESDTDSTRYAESEFAYWEEVVSNKNTLNDTPGDTYKATYDFSIPPIYDLQQLKIPVLVCYGTQDSGSPFNDYARVEMIRQGKKNFTFRAYIGLEHNFFPVTETGRPDYSIFNWDTVANEWWKWTLEN